MFLHNKFFAILQFLGKFLCDFLDKVNSSFLILHVSRSLLSEPDHPIDSPGTVPNFEIRVLDWFHEGQHLNIFVPNFLCRCLLMQIFPFRHGSHTFKDLDLCSPLNTFSSTLEMLDTQVPAAS